MNNCRPESAKWVKLKADDNYRCDCCCKIFESSRELKRHVFLWHSLSDIWRYYNRSVQALLGKRDFHECRQPILNTIKNGKFEEFIVNLLKKKAPFDPEVIDRSLPIIQCANQMSNQARITFYTQSRDIIRKIAEDIGAGKRILEYSKPVIETSEEMIVFSWNLSYDTHYERFPKDIARCLKYALMAERKLTPILPKYSRITRSDQIVSVEVSTLPI